MINTKISFRPQVKQVHFGSSLESLKNILQNLEQKLITTYDAADKFEMKDAIKYIKAAIERGKAEECLEEYNARKNLGDFNLKMTEFMGDINEPTKIKPNEYITHPTANYNKSDIEIQNLKKQIIENAERKEKELNNRLNESVMKHLDKLKGALEMANDVQQKFTLSEQISKIELGDKYDNSFKGILTRKLEFYNKELDLEMQKSSKEQIPVKVKALSSEIKEIEGKLSSL